MTNLSAGTRMRIQMAPSRTTRFYSLQAAIRALAGEEWARRAWAAQILGMKKAGSRPAGQATDRVPIINVRGDIVPLKIAGPRRGTATEERRGPARGADRPLTQKASRVAGLGRTCIHALSVWLETRGMAMSAHRSEPRRGLARAYRFQFLSEVKDSAWRLTPISRVGAAR
ncbi:hypothetical protein PLANTIT3_110054 [Plantibacter sp. T3]|nr:hypothetical protein PLANTIT3_110054 [Plantibacter sp. T3]